VTTEYTTELLTDEMLSILRERLAAWQAVRGGITPKPKTPEQQIAFTAYTRLLAKRNCAAGKFLSAMLGEIDRLQAILTDCPSVHQRKCWACGNLAWHAENRIPWVLCRKCGSADTRKCDKPEIPTPQPLGALPAAQEPDSMESLMMKMVVAIRKGKDSVAYEAKRKLALQGITIQFKRGLLHKDRRGLKRRH